MGSRSGSSGGVAGNEGRWDRHDDMAETVGVWSGAFDITFRDHIVSLGAGQCCVVPVGPEHHRTSPTGAELILFKTVPKLLESDCHRAALVHFDIRRVVECPYAAQT